MRWAAKFWCPKSRLTASATWPKRLARIANRKSLASVPVKKLHEEMITSSDSPSTIDLGGYYAILGAGMQNKMADYIAALKASPVLPGFAYESGSNPDFLSVAQIRSLIKTHLNPEFEPV